MPIHKRDRRFQKIISEVDIGEVPSEYIESVSLFFENGDEIVFEKEALESIEDENLFSFLMTAVTELGEDYGSPVSDLQIIIDYKKLEKQVKSITSDLLEKKNTND